MRRRFQKLSCLVFSLFAFPVALMNARFDTQQPLNLQSGLESDGNLALVLDLGQGRQLHVDFRQRSATLRTANSFSTIPWSELQFAALPTYAATDFELRVDLGSLGLRTGQTVTLNFDGSDELSEPLLLTMEPKASRDQPSADRRTRAPESIRIASLNTLRQGIASAERAPAIKNLFAYAGADIYCFNEELDESKFRASCFNVLPESFENKDAVHWSATCGIVSRYPLQALPFECREAAALIELPNGQYLVVVSAHFKCCGFADSEEDRRRVEEVNELLSDINRMRRGEFGEQAQHAGVVVLGDFNLVGSRKPLDLINAAGLKDVLLQCPIDGTAMTWRGVSPRESFWPGRLDYCVVDQQRLQPLGGFLLNTEQLNTLDPNYASDVLASDHSMMVIDFKLSDSQ
jgi:hypothetical protein